MNNSYLQNKSSTNRNASQENGLNVLMISTDRKFFEDGSAARQKIIEYGGLVEELYVVVFVKNNAKIAKSDANHANKIQISDNVWLYPTNSKSRWSYISDAVRIGKEIISGGASLKKSQGSSSGNYENWLVTTQDPFETGLAGYRIARKAKLPLQLQIHTDFLSPYFGQESFLNKVRVRIAKFLIRKATCVRVVSKRIKDSLDLRFKNHDLRITILPIFVDVEKIKNAPIKANLHEKYPQFDFIILMASRFTKEKNIKMAIGAIKDISNAKIGLVIVGDGPEKKSFERFVARHKLQDNIIFEEWSNDLSSYYKTADLFLLTSNYEGYGMTVVEAMAAECPVVMTDVGVAGELVKDGYNGIVVPVGDKAKLKEGILKMMEDKTMRASFILSSNLTASKFPTKEKYLKSYRQNWEECG
jgi:glycosyltransferase involved in cell wall biosynthesis